MPHLLFVSNKCVFVCLVVCSYELDKDNDFRCTHLQNNFLNVLRNFVLKNEYRTKLTDEFIITKVLHTLFTMSNI